VGGDQPQAGEGFEDEPAGGPGRFTDVEAGEFDRGRDREPDGAFDQT
jgi:hypothetical protein